MPDTFNKTYRYTKGIYEMKLFSTSNRDLLYYDNKLTDSNIASSVNMGEITAGIGNPTVIQLPDSAKFNITLTAADIDLRAKQLQTGGVLGYNGITDTCEIVTAADASLTVSDTPVAPYGSDIVACYVNGDGTAYEIDPSTKKVKDFVATNGTQYTVRYYIAKAASEVLDIKALFNPVVGTLEVKFPVYEAASVEAAATGTLVGYIHCIAPRYQFGGDATIAANQTTAATTALSGQALAYDANSEITCQAGSLSSLLYLVWEPLDATLGVKDMVVLGGGELTVAVGKTAMIPVKYVMADGLLAQPKMSDLAFESAATATASVADTGIVTGAAQGDTEITIENEELGLVAYCNVTVTAT